MLIHNGKLLIQLEFWKVWLVPTHPYKSIQKMATIDYGPPRMGGGDFKKRQRGEKEGSKI